MPAGATTPTQRLVLTADKQLHSAPTSTACMLSNIDPKTPRWVLDRSPTAAALQLYGQRPFHVGSCNSPLHALLACS